MQGKQDLGGNGGRLYLQMIVPEEREDRGLGDMRLPGWRWPDPRLSFAFLIQVQIGGRLAAY